MNDSNTYLIQLRGQVDEGEINAASPVQMTMTRGDKDGTLFTVHADQSGLVGLLRHLHGRGLVFVSIACER